ncbi:MAG: SDR family NAD(P)-dependent oxidoreductase [Spirochaetales bacterium]|nr:SDR family NAD(P)-dependent oxidoreductase [Spirochaetales bacterium]
MDEKKDQNLEAPTILVTGGTGGIGFQIARTLVSCGARLTVTGRDAARGIAASRELSCLGHPVRFVQADLSDQKGTLELAKIVLETHSRLDVLVNNVGGVWNRRETTADGLEKILAVNHVHPFLLSEALFQLLHSSSGKVIHLSTGYHLLVRVGPKDWLQQRWDSGMNVYGRAKLISLLAGRALCQRWAREGVVIQFADPGLAKTPLTQAMDATYFPWYGRWLFPAVHWVQNRLPLSWAGRQAAALALDRNDRRPGLYALPGGLRLPAFSSVGDRSRGQLFLRLTLEEWITPESQRILAALSQR